jgi:hypothetical protein
MGKRGKRIEAIRSNPKAVRPGELEQVLLDAGFSFRSGKGDHRRYTKGMLAMTLDFGKNPVNSVYVKQVLALITESQEEK